MNFNDFLTWLASSVGASAALSFIAERIPGFTNLSSSAKSYIMLVGSVAVALIAYAIAQLPPETLDPLKPWFMIVYGVVATWIANQVAHRQDPLANKRTLEEVEKSNGGAG